jgi:uncharacterized protein YebE (UPF0316 family)
MEWAVSTPIWLLCLVVFVLRVCDVSLGTVRTVAIVKGHITSSVVLGFFELMIWIMAISQVIARLHESWLLAFAYAGGFAAGNAVGILVERKLALGTSVVRILSGARGGEIARALRNQGHKVTTFAGEGVDGPVTLVYAMAPRRRTRQMITAAQTIDNDLMYVTEPAHESNGGVQLRLRPVLHATGWRAVFKKK